MEDWRMDVAAGLFAGRRLAILSGAPAGNSCVSLCFGKHVYDTNLHLPSSLPVQTKTNGSITIT
jgi:hypothetical protein